MCSGSLDRKMSSSGHVRLVGVLWKSAAQSASVPIQCRRRDRGLPDCSSNACERAAHVFRYHVIYLPAVTNTHRAPMRPPGPGSPFLTQIALREDRIEDGVHPFDIPLLRGGLALSLTRPVTFLVGENGSGKSTLLEALAWSVGFGAQGGNRDHQFGEDADGHALGRALQLTWRQRTTAGFFLRAETFFNFATSLKQVGSSFGRYGGRP